MASAPDKYSHWGDVSEDEGVIENILSVVEEEENLSAGEQESNGAADPKSPNNKSLTLPQKSVSPFCSRPQVLVARDCRERTATCIADCCNSNCDLPWARRRRRAVIRSHSRSPDVLRKIREREPSVGASIGVGKQCAVGDNDSFQSRHSEGKIECSVCYEPFGDTGDAVPRTLHCGHSFCSGCLRKLARSLKISCPKCTQLTTLDIHGVTNLIRNFAILELIYSHPIPQSSIKERQHKAAIKPTTPDGGSQGGNMISTHLCDEHGDHLTSFCMKDKVFVCSSCLLYGKHKQHPCKLVRDAAVDCRLLLSDLVPNVASQKEKMAEAVDQVTKVIELIKEKSDHLTKEVDDQFDKLVGVLNARRKELKLELFERGQIRVEALLHQLQLLQESVLTCEACHTLCCELMNADERTLLLHYSEAQRKFEVAFTNPPSCTPCARNDLRVEFPSDVLEELCGHFGGCGQLRSDVGTVENLYSDSYHNGFRVYWQGHNYVDSQGISYAMQVAKGDEEFITQYRGGDTKCTWKPDTLEDQVEYKFRVRVQTTDGVGSWSEPVSCQRQPPLFHWHTSWRNVKIELSPEKLEAWSTSSIHKLKYWCTVAGDTMIHQGQHYFEIELLKVWQRTSPKVALGVISFKNDALPSDIHWQEGKHPIGHSALTSSSLSSSFLPLRSQSSSHENYNSWSYLPSDGKKLSTQLENEAIDYGDIPPLQQGDRIGMLIMTRDGSISYFLNGQDLGVAFTDLAPPILPAVSLCDKVHLRLLFPPPPYMKRNPRLTLSSVSSSTDLL